MKPVFNKTMKKQNTSITQKFNYIENAQIISHSKQKPLKTNGVKVMESISPDLKQLNR